MPRRRSRHGELGGYPRELRLRKRRDFIRVQEQGAKTSSSLFLLLTLRRDSFPVEPAVVDRAGLGAGERRVGITVSTKVGNAVVRNRIKRWVREYARTRLAELPTGDLVVIAKRGAAAADHAAVDRDLDALFQRARRSR